MKSQVVEFRPSHPENAGTYLSECIVDLPLPPTGNHTYNPIGGQMVMSRAARQWADAAVVLWRLAGLPSLRHGKAPTKYRLTVTYTLYSDNRRDLDGSLKLALDALTRTLGVDDRYVTMIVCRKVYASAAQKQWLRMGVEIHERP